MEWWNKLWNSIVGFWNANWQPIVTFICVLVLGFIAIKLLVFIINKIFKRSHVITKTARHFMVTVIKAVLYVIYVIALLSLLGVPTTGMIAMLSAFALAVSLALQDTISNLASGVVLVFTKPFAEGDYIEINGGNGGTVDRISMFNTRLITPDNKIIVLPNNSVVTSAIANFSAQPTRRLDIPLSVAYGTDLGTVRKAGLEVAKANGRVLTDPEPMVRLDVMNESSLDLILRVWVNNADYWDAYFELREQVVAGFAKYGISIPFPQLDVHFDAPTPAAAKEIAATRTARAARQTAKTSAAAKTGARTKTKTK